MDTDCESYRQDEGERMSLIEYQLFGKVDKMDIAIKRLKKHEPPEGYYLAFSGGKDSMCIYELAKMSGVKFDAHFNLTAVDPPEVIKFTKKYYSDIILERPKTTMWKLIEKKMMPPTRMVRYCCEHLKERGGIGRTVVTGVRWAESIKRSKREIFFKDTRVKKLILNPIIDWTDADVWEFIKDVEKIPYCKLHDEGYKRIGCIMCPVANKKNMEKDAKRFPRFKKMYLIAFGRMLKRREERGHITDMWKTPEDVYNWWLGELKQKDNQPELFNYGC